MSELRFAVPYADILPPLSTEEQEALRLSIEREGVRVQPLVTEDGRTLDGHHRLKFRPDTPVAIIPGSAEWSDDECIAFVLRSNLHRRNLSPEQRKAVREQQKGLALRFKLAGMSQEEIAQLLSVRQDTISDWLGLEPIMGTHNRFQMPDCRVKVPGKEYQRIAERVTSGETLRQVAADYGIAHTHVARILRKHQQVTQQQAEPKEDFAGYCTTDDLHELISQGKTFGTIYADPPWAYGNQATRASTDNHYGTMSIEDIAALPVGDLAATTCHLHLWTTKAFMFECPKLLKAWGFTYQGWFTWCKPQMGIGNCWRVSSEVLLLAIRGEPRTFRDKSLMDWATYDRGQHSAKPEQVRLNIEKASPGPYLELFGRRPALGWTVWGNQIERSLFHQEAQL